MLSKIEKDKQTSRKTDLEKMKEIAGTHKMSNRALFTDDTAKKILAHKTDFKVEEE